MKKFRKASAALAVFFALCAGAYAPVAGACPVPTCGDWTVSSTQLIEIMESIENLHKEIAKENFTLLLSEVIDEVGSNQDDWMPVFQKRLEALRGKESDTVRHSEESVKEK
jgi:hypothetical protein